MIRRKLLACGSVFTLAGLLGCSKEDAAAAASKTPVATASAAAAEAAPASSSAVAPDKALELAATGSGFTIGPMMAAHTLYIFFDPQCPHCAELWNSVAQVGSRFKSVWMPVAFLAKISLQQGAAILSAADPSAVMVEHERLLMERKGGFDASKAPPPAEAVAKVAANTELLKKLGADSVPMLYFKHQRTGKPTSHSGSMPPAQLLELLGA